MVIRPRSLLFNLIFLSMISLFASASDIYYAQTEAGSNNGSDCADAYAYNDSGHGLNTSAPWTAGNTLHLCGTFNAPAGASEYIVAGNSGSSGNPIILKFEAGALLTAPYWSGCAIDLNGNSYIVVDGGTNGTIQATANGTSLANHQDNGAGVCSTSSKGASNDAVENLTISNIYLHSCTLPVTNCTDEGGQNTFGIKIYAGANDTIRNNTIHDMKRAVYIPYGDSGVKSSNLLVYNNTIYNEDHGVVFGDQGSNSVLVSSNCSSAIYNNDFSTMQNWDDSGDYNHHDAIHLWANNSGSGSSYSGVCVYSNYFHGDAGSNDNTIFGMESYGNGNYIFNNVVSVSGSSHCATGAIGVWTGSGTPSSTQHVLNNTISPTANCANSANFEQTSGDVLENNLILSGNPTYVYTDGVSGDLATANYNSYATAAGANPFYGPSGCPSGATFSSWKNNCGYDVNGQNVSIAINADFTLPAGSKAIGAASNLTELGLSALNIGAPQTFGVSGSCGTGCISRPSTGAWDAGAYPYTASTPSPNPPTGLTATVQ